MSTQADQSSDKDWLLIPLLLAGGIFAGKAFWDAMTEDPPALVPEPGPARSPSRPKPRPAPGDGFGGVGGLRELKEILRNDVVRAFRETGRMARWGLTPPNGILLYGPPGCGKTLIARALAAELGCRFQEIVPSTIGSPFIHQTGIRIRNAFATAAASAPAVIFIDELEALVPARAGLGGHQDYKSEEVNEFLVQLDDCATRGVLVIAATNEPWKIDRAILRTGRMDKLVYVGAPDAAAREEILTIHLLGRLCEANLDVRRVADSLDGYCGSDIRFLVDESARFAERHDRPISTEILLRARERVGGSVTGDEEAIYRSFGQRGI